MTFVFFMAILRYAGVRSCLGDVREARSGNHLSLAVTGVIEVFMDAGIQLALRCTHAVAAAASFMTSTGTRD